MTTLKSLKEYITRNVAESKDPHVILQKYTGEIHSEHPNKEAAYHHLIDTMRFHPAYTVLPKADAESGKHPYKKSGAFDLSMESSAVSESTTKYRSLLNWRTHAKELGHDIVTIRRGFHVAYDKYGTKHGEFGVDGGDADHMGIKRIQGSGGYLNIPKKPKTLPESKMSDLHIILQDHLDHHIKAYKEGRTGPDTFGTRVVKAHAKIAQEAGIAHEHAAKFANEYVDSKLQ